MSTICDAITEFIRKRRELERMELRALRALKAMYEQRKADSQPLVLLPKVCGVCFVLLEARNQTGFCLRHQFKGKRPAHKTCETCGEACNRDSRHCHLHKSRNRKSKRVLVT